MLVELTTALLALANMVSSSSAEVRIASPALSSERVLLAIEGASRRGVPVQVLLGATPIYVLDERGQPTGPSRPFDKGPQGPELGRLDATGARTFIPPRFNEMGIDAFQPGTQAHMAYAVVDHAALVCTAPLSAGSVRGLCLESSVPDVVQALRGVHRADMEDRMSDTQRARHLAAAARAGVVVTPEARADMVYLLEQPWESIHTALLSDGTVVEALLRSPRRPEIWLSPGAPHARTAIRRLEQAGYRVKLAAQPFDGTLLAGNQVAFLGSQRLDDFHLNRSRDVGVLLRRADAESVKRLLPNLRGDSRAQDRAAPPARAASP